MYKYEHYILSAIVTLIALFIAGTTFLCATMPKSEPKTETQQDRLVSEILYHAEQMGGKVNSSAKENRIDFVLDGVGYAFQLDEVLNSMNVSKAELELCNDDEICKLSKDILQNVIDR